MMDEMLHRSFGDITQRCETDEEMFRDAGAHPVYSDSCHCNLSR